MLLLAEIEGFAEHRTCVGSGIFDGIDLQHSATGNTVHELVLEEGKCEGAQGEWAEQGMTVT